MKLQNTSASNEFKKRVLGIVSQIPAGKVMTYGQIAALCGSPRSARIVGGIAHFGPQNLPWHRVVNKHGGLARGYPGGPEVQKQLLQAEGVSVVDYKINISEYLWTLKQNF